MRLLRIVVLRFDPFPEGFESFRYSWDDAVFETIQLKTPFDNDGKRRLLAVAHMHLEDLPSRDTDGFLSIPDAARRHLEAHIETTAATIAVLNQCRHTISSASPPVSLIAESETERQFLEESRGFVGSLSGQIGVSGEIRLTPQIISGLTDRRDGLLLLAHAFAHQGALARYREFMRFFELAFAQPTTTLEKKLWQFLSGNQFGYSRAEVRSWLALRHGAVHGDLKNAPGLVLEADVRPLICRIEQAALDVLLNKKTWHNSSRERRSLWFPTAGTTSANTADLFTVQGTRMVMSVKAVDQFRVYPFDLSACMTDRPPEWWTGSQSSQTEIVQGEGCPI